MGEEAPPVSLLRGEKRTGGRSRTVDDKDWQIRAKAGEPLSGHGLFHRRLILITIGYYVMCSLSWLGHVPGIEPARGVGDSNRIRVPIRKPSNGEKGRVSKLSTRRQSDV
jgi:hypothetical protein